MTDRPTRDSNNETTNASTPKNFDIDKQCDSFFFRLKWLKHSKRRLIHMECFCTVCVVYVCFEWGWEIRLKSTWKSWLSKLTEQLTKMVCLLWVFVSIWFWNWKSTPLVHGLCLCMQHANAYRHRYRVVCFHTIPCFNQFFLQILYENTHTFHEDSAFIFSHWLRTSLSRNGTIFRRTETGNDAIAYMFTRPKFTLIKQWWSTPFLCTWNFVFELNFMKILWTQDKNTLFFIAICTLFSHLR